MRYAWVLGAMMALPAATTPNSVLPEGTIIPISLSKDLDAARAHVGQEIRAKVMQDIPGTQVRRGADVLGHVSHVSSSKDGLVRFEMFFDEIKVHGLLMPINSNIRALAAPAEITDAESAMYGPADGIEAAHVSTTQIGSGDMVFHGGGPVFAGSTEIGKSIQSGDGVLVEPRANQAQHCRGMVGDTGKIQALWLFSSDACGVYGFQHIRIEHAGRTDPVGTIILIAENGKLKIDSQSGLLLRVQGSQRTDAGNDGDLVLAER